jgi:SAM-dependent methyltransferase
VYRGFPSSLLRLLRCSRDGAELALEGAAPAAPFIEQGSLRCTACGAIYGLEGGIVSMLPDAPICAESAHEMQQRDGQFVAPARAVDPFIAKWRHATEVEPTLNACEPIAGKVVAEFGCGAGRFTVPLAGRAAAVLAVDLSRECLVKLGERIDETTPVGLVWADIGSLHLAPASFDCILSTAHSNLPTREHRLASNRIAAEALTSTGRYVFSMHFHAAHDFLHAIPAAGHYDGTGIFRYHMRAAEARREVAPFFARVRFAPILMSLPAVRSITMTRVAMHIPGVNSLASLLLGVARRPRREPPVDYVSPWSRWVTRVLGRQPADSGH